MSWALLALLAGCTFAPGGGWVTLERATLDAALVPGEARDLGEDRVLSDLAWTVQLHSLWLELGEVELQELQGGLGASFDPADPPAGYSLCHGGHCHASDGSLVSYAEIEAELAGGGASWQTVVWLPVERELDLLGGEVLELDVLPSPELPMADLGRLGVAATRLELEASASVEGSDEVQLMVDLPLGGAFSADLDLRVDRDQSPRIQLDLTLEPGGTLFDGLDFANLATDGVLEITSSDDPGAEALTAALLSTVPDAILDTPTTE